MQPVDITPYAENERLRNSIRGNRSPEDFILFLRAEQKSRAIGDDELREYVQIHRDKVMAAGIGLEQKLSKQPKAKKAAGKQQLPANIDDLLGELDAL